MRYSLLLCTTLQVCASSAGHLHRPQFPAKCEPAMDAWCNTNQADASCVTSVVAKGGKTPLQAAFGPDHDGSGNQLRCYSPSCFVDGGSPRNGTFKKGCSLYCTRPELASILHNCTSPLPPPSGSSLNVSLQQSSTSALWLIVECLHNQHLGRLCGRVRADKDPGDRLDPFCAPSVWAMPICEQICCGRWC